MFTVWYYLWFKCIFLFFNHIQLYCFYHHEKQNKTKQTHKQTNNYCWYNQLLLKNITVFSGRINYWWWENANKQDHASHGAWKTLASFNFFQKFIVLQRVYHHARRRNWINKDVQHPMYLHLADLVVLRSNYDSDSSENQSMKMFTW